MSKQESDHTLLREGLDAYFAEPPECALALELFSKITRQCPEWSEGHLWLANVLEKLSEPEAAIKTFQTAIRLDGQDTRPLISLGRFLSGLGRHEEGIQFLERGLDLRPHYAEADARCMLADAYVGAGRMENALEQWRLVSQMEPFYPSYDEPIDDAKEKLAEHGSGD